VKTIELVENKPTISSVVHFSLFDKAHEKIAQKTITNFPLQLLNHTYIYANLLPDEALPENMANTLSLPEIDHNNKFFPSNYKSHEANLKLPQINANIAIPPAPKTEKTPFRFFKNIFGGVKNDSVEQSPIQAENLTPKKALENDEEEEALEEKVTEDGILLPLGIQMNLIKNLISSSPPKVRINLIRDDNSPPLELLTTEFAEVD
jgi:hypothetical protein